MLSLEDTIDAGNPEHRRQTVKYFSALRLARAEFRNTTDSSGWFVYTGGGSDFDLFAKWINENYGIIPLQDESQNLLPSYTITDEEKHLVFLLKFFT